MNKRRRLLTLLINGVLLSSLCMVANAADNVAGAGSGVAIGTGSSAQKDGVVAIGKGAHTNYAGGSGYAKVNGECRYRRKCNKLIVITINPAQ